MLEVLFSALARFVFLYPATMSAVWVVGGLYFWWRRERCPGGERWPARWPPVTILVPCHNEEKTVGATCENLRRLDYPDYRVVLIDDASRDGTLEALRREARLDRRFHVLRLLENQGKARALNLALAAAVTTPVTVVIDADTMLAPDALRWLVAPFMRQPRLGAVTGNPVPYNRGGLLEKVQAAEFASIVGLVKRSQRVLGRVLTVSGCIAAYRTEALRAAGGFSGRTATEDIDVTWRLQRRFYEVWFAPQAVAHIQVPSTLRDLWKQRKRWALGGWHLLRTHAGVFARWRWRRLWPVYLEFVLGCVWAFAFVLGSLLWAASAFVPALEGIGASPVPAWYGAVLSFASVVQSAAAVIVNGRYDRDLWKTLFWVPWHPLFFFALMPLAAVWTAPRGLFARLERAGRWAGWASPARGEVAEFPAKGTGTAFRPLGG